MTSTIWNDINAKVLIQNPGKTNTIRWTVQQFDNGLKEQIPNKHNKDVKRKLHIYKKIIWIVEEDKFNSIFIRNNVSEPCTKANKYDQCRTYNINIAYENPETFYYWNFLPQTFDIIISPNPVRLDMLKENGIIIKF